MTARYTSQHRLSLLLIVVLLAMQSLMFWHQHDDSAIEDEHCQLCLFSHHHTPAAGTANQPLTLIFTQYLIREPAYAEPAQSWHRHFSLARAPPVTLS
jgi:hypothetical protein